MVVFASVFAVVLVVLVLTSARATVGVLGQCRMALFDIKVVLKGMSDPAGEDFRTRLDALSRTVEELPRIWETQKRAADNAEARARYHAKHALDALEEHGFEATPGLATAGADLFDGDAGGSGGVQPVPGSVEESPVDISWEEQVRRKKYG